MVMGLGEWGRHHQEYLFCRESNRSLDELPAIILSIFSEGIYIPFLLPVPTPPLSTYMPSLSLPPSTTPNPIPTPLQEVSYSIPPPIPPSTHASRAARTGTGTSNEVEKSTCNCIALWHDRHLEYVTEHKTSRQHGDVRVAPPHEGGKKGRGEKRSGWEFLYGKFLAGGG